MFVDLGLLLFCISFLFSASFWRSFGFHVSVPCPMISLDQLSCL